MIAIANAWPLTDWGSLVLGVFIDYLGDGVKS